MKNADSQVIVVRLPWRRECRPSWFAPRLWGRPRHAAGDCEEIACFFGSFGHGL